jgi:tryptophan synthase alpha chain
MTVRIAATFARLKDENAAAFIPYIMAGDPSLADSLNIMKALAEHGADILEIGFPFSDPTADGVAIQAAANRALAMKVTLEDTMRLCQQFRQENTITPIILMGYANPLMRYGYKNVAQRMKQAGVDGIIVVDLPPEEEAELRNHLEDVNICCIRLIAPTSTGERLATLLQSAEGFVYNIAIKGITGTSSALQTDIKQRISDIRMHTDVPIVTGFGIKNATQAKEIMQLCDGAVIGSTLVEICHNAVINGDDPARVAETFAREIADVKRRKPTLMQKVKGLFGVT